MTQASLSPDLNGALGAPTSSSDAGARTGVTSESALWIIALTATALIIASILMLGLLARAVVDASFGGFLSGVSIMMAAIGVGALAYVLVTARRLGHFGSDEKATAPSSSATPSGMHVVSAVPAALGARYRQAMRDERSSRSKQAKAIAVATPAPRRPAPVAPPRPAPAVPPRPAPRPSPARVAQAAPPRVAPAPARQAAAPAPARQVAAPAPARATSAVPVRMAPPQAKPKPVVRQAIRMPQRPMRLQRPAAWPIRPPAMRAAPRPMHPRAQVPLFQVNAVNLRTPAPPYRR